MARKSVFGSGGGGRGGVQRNSNGDITSTGWGPTAARMGETPQERRARADSIARSLGVKPAADATKLPGNVAKKSGSVKPARNVFFDEGKSKSDVSFVRTTVKWSKSKTQEEFDASVKRIADAAGVPVSSVVANSTSNFVEFAVPASSAREAANRVQKLGLTQATYQSDKPVARSHADMAKAEKLPNPSSRGNVGDATAAETKAHYDKWGPNTEMKFEKSSDARGADPATTIRTGGKTIEAPPDSATAVPAGLRPRVDGAPIAEGTIVKFKSAVDGPGDLDRRMVVVEDRGDRVLVRTHESDPAYMPNARIQPTAVYSKAELLKQSSVASNGAPGGAGTTSASVTGARMMIDNVGKRHLTDGAGNVLNADGSKSGSKLSSNGGKVESGGGWEGQPRVPAGNPDGGQWTDA